MLKVSLCYLYNIYISTRSDWLWVPYILNYFEPELFWQDGPFIKNISSVETRKNVIYSKLGNNPFKYLEKPEKLTVTYSQTKWILKIRIIEFCVQVENSFIRYLIWVRVLYEYESNVNPNTWIQKNLQNFNRFRENFLKNSKLY